MNALLVTLQHMGYALDVDFVLVGDPPRVQWISAQPQPTQAEIDAAMPGALAAAARAAIRPVSARQMLLALEETGLLTTIESYVSTQPKAVKISWSRTQGFERNDPMLNTGAKALGMTDEQIDNLFQLAASK